MKKAVLTGLALAVVVQPAAAAERAKARVACTATGEKLVYRCAVTLTGRKSGKPISGAVVRVGADMPNMPMAHNVRPVALDPAGKPGRYRFAIALEMYGVWVLKLRMSKPTRDIIIVRLRFTRDGAAPTGKMKGHGNMKSKGHKTN